jgi:hypothetical protein
LSPHREDLVVQGRLSPHREDPAGQGQSSLLQEVREDLVVQGRLSPHREDQGQLSLHREVREARAGPADPELLRLDQEAPLSGRQASDAVPRRSPQERLRQG